MLDGFGDGHRIYNFPQRAASPVYCYTLPHRQQFEILPSIVQGMSTLLITY